MDNTPAPGTTPHANVLPFFSRPPSPLPPLSPSYTLSPSYAFSPSPERSSPGPNLGSIGGNPGSPDPVFDQLQFQFDEQDLPHTPDATLPPNSPPALGPVLVRLRPDWHPPMLFEPPQSQRNLLGDFVTETDTQLFHYPPPSEA